LLTLIVEPFLPFWFVVVVIRWRFVLMSDRFYDESLTSKRYRGVKRTSTLSQVLFLIVPFASSHFSELEVTHST
jgi:hypothetical protein